MATAVQTLVDEVGEYGFDVEAAQVLRQLDRRHKTMVARAKSNRKMIAVGPTVIDQAAYAVDALEIFDVAVAGVPYGKAPRSAQASALRGLLSWSPSSEGLWVATADGSGVWQIALIPTPAAAGDPITAFAAMPAADLTLVGNLAVDDDMADALVEGVAATFLRRDTEQRGAGADADQVFDMRCEEYRQRVARRFRGSGPAQIRVLGVNA